MLDSECFAQADRHRRFLKFVVEEHLRHRGRQIKGYTIAVDVFERADDFDAQTDPLVRVEAGRLRKRLAEYYSTEGRFDPWRISIPKGSYEPSFERFHGWTAERPASGHPTRQIATVTLAVLGVAIAALLFVQPAWHREEENVQPLATVGRELPGWPRVFVVPFENLSSEQNLRYFAQGVSEEILLRLSDFQLVVVSGTGAPSIHGAASSGVRKDRSVDVDYVLTGSVRVDPLRVRLTARLVDASSNDVLWSGQYDAAPSPASIFDTEERIAREVVQTIARPYGPIFEREFVRLNQWQPNDINAYQCVLKFYAYRRHVDVAAIPEATACLEVAVQSEPNYADAWAALALVLLDGSLYGEDPVRADNPAEAIRAAAEHAVELDADNYFAWFASARVRFLTGDLRGFMSSLERALSLAPTDPLVLVGASQMLTLVGDLHRGADLLERAWQLSPDPTIHHYVAETLLRVSTGEYDRALEAALRIDAPNWYASSLFVVITAGLANRPDLGSRAAARLLELRPDFDAEARELFAAFNVNDTLAAKLFDGLRRSGIDTD